MVIVGFRCELFQLSLTREGEVFRTRCSELLRGFEEAEAEIGTPGVEVDGILRINVPFSFGPLYLSPLWMDSRPSNRKPCLTLHRPTAWWILSRKVFDIAVRFTRVPDSSLGGPQLTSIRVRGTARVAGPSG